MIVADLIKAGMFTDFKIIAGTKGISREVSGVSVLDSPDVDRWMRGGEFLIGSMYIFKEEPELMATLLEKLSEVNISAFGIKIDRYHTSPPESLVCKSEALGIPLIEIPLNYRWVDIIELVQEALFRERQHRLSNDINEKISIWENSWDIKKIISGLAQVLQREVYVKVPELELDHLFLPGGEAGDKQLAKQYQEAVVLNEISTRQLGNISCSIQNRLTDHGPKRSAVFLIKTDPDVEMHLVFIDGEQRPLIHQERMCLRALDLIRSEIFETRILSLEIRAKKERFIENLCLGTYNSSEMVFARANELGFEIPEKASVLEVATIERKRIPCWKPPYPLTLQIANQWVSIVDTETLEREFNKFSRIAKEKKLWISLGTPIKGWENIRHSYEDSKRGLQWLREFQPFPGVYRYKELALYSFLTKAITLPEANGLWQRFWSPLLEEPPNRRAIPLLKVAKALVKSDFNQKQCAESLHLHYNTARNYITELEKMLQIDLTKRLHRMALVLSYCIHCSRENDHWEDLI